MAVTEPGSPYWQFRPGKVSAERRLIAGLPRSLHLDDDAALLADGRTLLAGDTLAEGTHFRLDWCTPRDIAHKLLYANLSDIWVKGGIALHAVFHAAMTPAFMKRDAAALYQELQMLCRRECIILAGGDTTIAASNVFSLTLVGNLPSGADLIPRRAATIPPPGTIVAVSGPVGGSEWARRQLEAGRRLSGRGRRYYTRPEPTRPGLWLREAIATMDLSDSLLESLSILASANKVCLEVTVSDVPLVPEFERERPSVEQIMASAEDFVVVALLGPGLVGSPVRPWTGIGRVVSGRTGVVIR